MSFVSRMTVISFPAIDETDGRPLWFRKASECYRIAMTTEDPEARRAYLKLSQRWREMAVNHTMPEASGDGGVVLRFPQRFRSVE
jgi:hypothetical protein